MSVVDEAGDVINYTITVANTGNTTLDEDSVKDLVESYGLSDAVALDADTDGFNDGDTNTDGELDVSVLSNYTGKPHVSQAAAIRSRLFFQLFNPVRWVACMNQAIDTGIDTIVEFGGGIGKGEGPADKRPNLEGIVKKSLKWRQHEAEYLAAINSAGIRAAAESFNSH